jgi:hypothetical protein
VRLVEPVDPLARERPVLAAAARLVAVAIRVGAGGCLAEAAAGRVALGRAGASTIVGSTAAVRLATAAGLAATGRLATTRGLSTP